MEEYDVIIKSGRKDYDKLPLVINSLRWLRPQPDGVYIITPDGYMPSGTDYDGFLHRLLDDEVMPGCDRAQLAYRPNWCWQVLVDLVIQVTKHPYFLDVQADNFFVKPLDLFNEEGRPRFFLSPQHRHYHPPYWVMIKKLFDLERQPHPVIGPMDSFIIDFMLMDRRVTEGLFGYDSLSALWEAYYPLPSHGCHLSEYELYAHWCLAFHPVKYEIVPDVPVRLLGKHWPDQWSLSEIQHQLEHCGDAVAVSCHTWT